MPRLDEKEGVQETTLQEFKAYRYLLSKELLRTYLILGLSIGLISGFILGILIK